MNTTTSKQFPARTNLTEKLTEKEYRAAFVETEIRRGLPFQIRAIREARGWNQQTLGEAAGIEQGNISRIENTRDTFLSFPTLLKIAEAYDVALVVKFAPFSELEEFAKRPVEDMIPANYLSDSAEREAWEAAASAGETPVGDSSANAHDFLVRMFAGRQLPSGGPDWKVFSSKKYTNETGPAIGGLNGTTRSSQGSLSLQRSTGTDEPKRKSA